MVVVGRVWLFCLLLCVFGFSELYQGVKNGFRFEFVLVSGCSVEAVPDYLMLLRLFWFDSACPSGFSCSRCQVCSGCFRFVLDCLR